MPSPNSWVVVARSNVGSAASTPAGASSAATIESAAMSGGAVRTTNGASAAPHSSHANPAMRRIPSPLSAAPRRPSRESAQSVEWNSGTTGTSSWISASARS